MSENKTALINAFHAYVGQLEKRGKKWQAGDNPVAGRDDAIDLREQQQRLSAVFNTVKSGENQEDYADMIAAMPKDDPVKRMQYKFENYLSSLTFDIRAKLTSPLKIEFDKMLVAFQPTGYTNACAITTDPGGKPLDGGLIFLNQGLYFSAGFAAKAIVLANVQGKHEHMQDDAKPVLLKGVEFYLSRNPAQADSEFHSTGNPTEEGEVATHISSVKAKMLEFVILHEFAHIILDHHAYNEATRLTIFNEEDELADYHSTTTETQKLYNLEFAADQFAFDVIAKASSNTQSKLANLYAIGALFVFLECIESRLNRALSKTHPAPLERLQRLANYLDRDANEKIDFSQHHEGLLSLSRNWNS